MICLKLPSCVAFYCFDEWKRIQFFEKGIHDAHYAQTKKACKGFEIKSLGEHYDLYVQSYTLLLPDVFENFRDIFLEIYELDPAKYLPAPGLAWEAALKRLK